MKAFIVAASLLVLSLGSAAHAQTASSANPEAQTLGAQPPNIGTNQSGDKSVPYNMDKGATTGANAAGNVSNGTSGSSTGPYDKSNTGSVVNPNAAGSSGNPTGATPKIPNH